MCTVSMVYDWGRSLPERQWDHQKYDDFLEAVRKAGEIDKLTNQPDCEDPAKADFLKKIEERLGIVERRLDAADTERRERAELERLKAKYEPARAEGPSLPALDNPVG